MKKDVRIIFEDTAYRYMPNTSIENDVLDKVRHTIDNNKFAGNFYSSLWQGGGDGYLYELDEHDDYLVRRQNLKEGERIYRYFTRRSAFTGQVPLIKINIDKGLLYFLNDDENLDLIEFETKGIPVRYLNIIPPQNEEYAEGGETEKKVLKYRVTYKKMVDGEYGTSIVYFYNKESAEKFAEEHDTIVEEINDDDLGKIIKKYLYVSGIERPRTLNNNAKQISKKDVVFFISLSKDSETKYLVNDLNDVQTDLPDWITAHYYIYKGNLLKSTYEKTPNKFLGMSIISSNALPDEHKFQLHEKEVKDYEKEQDPRAEKLIGRTIQMQVIKNEEGDLMPMVTKINKVIWPSLSYPNPMLTVTHNSEEYPYNGFDWQNKFKGEEIDKFLNGEEIKNSEYRGWWTMKLMKEMKKMAEGGSVDVIKKDRYGNDVKIGDAIHIRVLTGRYGQTKDYEGVVSNFDQFGNVELDGQRSLTYTKDYKFDDYEHGHHIWVEKIKEKDIKENLRVPKKYVSTYSGTINGEKFAINGKDKFQEWLDENYPSSVLGAWNTLYNKGWKYKNSTKEYISPENLSYDMIDVYASAEQGQGFSYSLMIPTDKSEYAQGGFMAEGGITDDEDKLELDSDILKQDYDKIVASKLFNWYDVNLAKFDIEISGGEQTLISYYDIYGKHFETKREGKYFEIPEVIEQLKKISGWKYSYKITKRTIENDIEDDEYNFRNTVEKIERIIFTLTPVINKMAEGGMMANRNKIKWQDVYTGDKALVVSENKMGYVIKPYGRRFHLRFPDGTEKTYSAEELEFFKDEEYAEGGFMADGGYVIPSYYILKFGFHGDDGYETGTSKPIMATSEQDAIEKFVDQFESYEGISVDVISVSKQMAKGGMTDDEGNLIDIKGGGLLMIPNNIADEIKKSISMGYTIIREGLISPKRKGIMLSNEDYQVRGTYPLELKNAIQQMIDNSKMKKGGTLEFGVKKNMLFDKNGERRVDPEALAYIENTVEMLPQTKFMHTKENGQYTPERKKLHDEIIATFHEGKPCIEQRPAVAILTGGAPASGKTTFIKKYVDLDPDKVYHVDADEVRAMLPEYKGYNATQTHLETADMVNQLIDEIGVPCDHDLIYDGTMNKATKYEKIVEKLHKLGYKVFVVYISIPEQVSKERVISRYKKAGRYVPMKVIEEVYDNGLKAFEKVAYEMADGYIRIDGMNGEIIEQGGMSMPSNIEYDKGGEIADNKLKNGTALVRSAERYAEAQTGEAVDKGKGMARAFKLDGKMAYNSVIVFFKNGEHVIYDEDEFPKFFMKDGGELGGQDYYDGFQMQVVQKKGNPDKEVQKENIKMSYRKGGKL